MRNLLLFVLIFAGVGAYAQQTKAPLRFEYSPEMNDSAIKGKITAKFTAMKDGNPVSFVEVQKAQIAIWDVELYKTFKIGTSVKLTGLVPLRWIPEAEKVELERPIEGVAIAKTKE